MHSSSRIQVDRFAIRSIDVRFFAGESDMAMIFRTPRPIRIVLELCLEQFGATSDSHSTITLKRIRLLERLAVSDENDIMVEELRCLDLLRSVHNGEPHACA
jgi:hypothetical protein